jgi:signal transduction histidine kinase
MDDAEYYLRTVFLERLSHELKGPLGVTLGVLDELEASHESEPARIAQLLAMARRSSRRLVGVAERLQRTAQLERGAIDWHRERHDLRDAAERALERARELDSRRGIGLQVVRCREACWADVDVAWVTMATSELLLNAIRNARSRVVLSTSCGDGEVRLQVHDDGLGFSGPVAPRFLPTSRPQGLGLSLCLAEDVARAHGGGLTIDASAETGAHLTLRFPAVGPTSQSAAR